MRKHPIYFLFILFAWTACEKVIDVDLNEANPAVVIEGNLVYNERNLEVKISRTGSYFGDEPLNKVSGAEVYLETSRGIRVEAAESDQGMYSVGDLPLEAGHEYRLQVELEGNTYSASSYLNQPVLVDSLGYEYYDGIVFFEGGYRLNLYFTDPATVDNYYRIKVYRNDTLQNDIDDLIVFDDEGFSGKAIQVRLRGQTFEPGDTARVDFITLDEKAYEYFSSLRELANTNPGSPAPANPISNFNNDALGYFAAWGYDTRTVIISE